ncbi:MAG: hypothetical protein QM784_17150 [Polyangiaceae bacterium]
MPFLNWALESKRLRYLPDVITLVLAATVTLPIWVVARPPLQDFPQHVAAVRVLSSYFEPSFRFAEYFELTLGRTQYLTVYLVAAALAKVSSPLFATKVVLSASLIALPYTLLRLLRALGRCPWLAMVSLPLLFNVHVAFGFLNFIFRDPAALLGARACVSPIPGAIVASGDHALVRARAHVLHSRRSLWDLVLRRGTAHSLGVAIRREESMGSCAVVAGHPRLAFR